MKRLTAGLLILTLSCAAAFAQAAKPRSTAELQASISALLDQPKFASARWGALIKTVDGRVVYERDSDKVFTPASNMKLYTTSAALDAFGPDFRIRTSVYATGPAGKSGTLRGDLILYGRGDPNLSTRFDDDIPGESDGLNPADRIIAIENLADQIAARGIKVITGNIVGDESYFAGDRLGPSWEWDDLQFYYGAEISALTVNDNSVTLTVTPGRRVGDKPSIKVQPQTAYLKVINQAMTTDRGTARIDARRPLESNTVELFGTIPHDAGEHVEDIAVHDPASFAATLLKEALTRRRIRVLGKVQRADAMTRIARPFVESKLTEIAALDSLPMSEMLKVINKPSQNLHAELMLRQLGKLRKDEEAFQSGIPANGVTNYPELDDYGRPKSTAILGNEKRRAFLQKAGVETPNLSLRDGSGLSRQNLVSPRSTTRLLEFMLTHPHSAVFIDSLVIAGVDGTLERRMRNTAAANNFRGKTGTLSYVNALSGYVTTKRGQKLVFSIMGNNFVGAGRDVTSVMDGICVMLADFEAEIE